MSSLTVYTEVRSLEALRFGGCSNVGVLYFLYFLKTFLLHFIFERPCTFFGQIQIAGRTGNILIKV